MTNRPALDQLITRQNCVITRQQALDCGMNRDAIYRRLRTAGQWQRILPGVYLTVTGSATSEQRDVAAVLYAGPGGTLTAAAALGRHHSHVLPADTIDVLVPANRQLQSRGFVAVHRTKRLPEYVCYLGPVQYALRARAVGDAVRGLKDLVRVRGVVAAAVQTKLCTVEQLKTELKKGRSADRRSSAPRSVRSPREPGRVPEVDLQHLIRRGGLPKPLFNPLLYLGNELLARPDAWWPDMAVIVEVDSKQWHLSPESWEETMRRHARLQALGILVLHFSPRQIRDEPREVLATIREALDTRRGHRGTSIRTVSAAA
jgi:hypothetical protein